MNSKIALGSAMLVLVFAGSIHAAPVAETVNSCYDKTQNCLDKCPAGGGFSARLCRDLCFGDYKKCICGVDKSLPMCGSGITLDPGGGGRTLPISPDVLAPLRATPPGPGGVRPPVGPVQPPVAK